jgi:hypothetical protein
MGEVARNARAGGDPWVSRKITPHRHHVPTRPSGEGVRMPSGATLTAPSSALLAPSPREEKGWATCSEKRTAAIFERIPSLFTQWTDGSRGQRPCGTVSFSPRGEGGPKGRMRGANVQCCGFGTTRCLPNGARYWIRYRQRLRENFPKGMMFSASILLTDGNGFPNE